MSYCISVKFIDSKKSYYFQTDDETLDEGSFVVVDTVVGQELGKVISPKMDMSQVNFNKEIKPILRKATKNDLSVFKQNQQEIQSAKKIFEKYVKELNLNMRIVKIQYTLDREKILFTYFSEERVDFRELLKKLASNLKCRIELRQITARERAMLVGGYGVCGLPLCCTYMYSNQEGVSLNKAKNQMLTINIPKLSGVCGKLMCCLKFEDDFYTEAKKEFPAINTQFKYNGEDYKVNSYNVLTKIVKISSVDNVEFLPLTEVKKYIKQSGTNNFKKPQQMNKETKNG